ncbi:tRNA (uridine(34)/cytosine(34)/5-carboxymethylaminomethyluridine(34)-2'-O)-methyltransferase TrmL [Lacticaseibacillus absianus]|uniref:tRNA (uridine(34)/cytosine(34)/5- carboxymethylaminomethyluridine(34)-2'-O)- methyltransferase TrmL n=1 Tax=Lacticaseibacillus absianus TaxID=2729623 RepID=UPI0015C6EC6F|nr:tRNA (uridine(34)/cytosine(34)/5-carboxymethylaminomethyluridine(34)-2'-O)-methyltransferase TrmL [Lacticaseibacillus absianus]
MSNHIVLFEPLIPANTGNIARTAAATDSYLHLIEPLGFELDDKHLRRAGLDYWQSVKVVMHRSLAAFMATVPDQRYLYLVSKFAAQTYSDVDYSDPTVEHYFMFGKETTGLPEPFMRANPEKAVRIPMTDNVRALNLSNCAALVVYEALRQQAFAGLERVHAYPHDKLK